MEKVKVKGEEEEVGEEEEGEGHTTNAGWRGHRHYALVLHRLIQFADNTVTEIYNGLTR